MILAKGTRSSRLTAETSGRAKWLASWPWAALPATLFGLFMVLGPLAVVFGTSFFRQSGVWMEPAFTGENYQAIATTGRLPVIFHTMQFAAATTGLAIVLGYPLAYTLAMVVGDKTKVVLFSLFTVPFILAPLIRLQGLRLLLGSQGLINVVATSTGLSHQPISWLLFTDFSIYVGLLASYLPLAIFPIWLSLESIDRRQLESGADLGARPLQVFTYLTLPMSAPGIFPAAIFVFVAVMGDNLTPVFLGGAGRIFVGSMMVNILNALQFPLVSAIATLIIVVMAVLFIIGERAFKIHRVFGSLER